MLWIWLARASTRLTAVSLGLIIGGAIGNAIDRFAYGAVADFVLFHVYHGQFQLRLVRFQPGGCGHRRRGRRPLVRDPAGKRRRKSALILARMAAGMRHISPLLEGDSKGIAMRNQDSTRQRRGAAAGAVALALALGLSGVGLSAVGWSTHAFAQNADDDENVPLDTKMLRQFLKDLGLRRDGESDVGIDYRERAPLVVPPSRNLPKPQNEAAVTNSPAWPTDPDVKRRKEATAAEKARLRGGVSAEEQQRALRPSELDQPGRGKRRRERRCSRRDRRG